ncbi:GntR family transcriptional regulator [Ruminococcaceae bacterium OttesenSCG-928-I18]|nr:GntR family transcriptional regulator [Ruminococcaceae bacterium OttesenSCG-928-I18]
MVEWQIDNDRPVYTQLVEQMERAVASGVFGPGQRLPGVREMAAEAGVNPNTMQRALQALEQTGLVHAKRTSGRFVTEDRELILTLRKRQAESLTGRWVRDMRALGCDGEEIDRYYRQVREAEDGNDLKV